jgi:two-component system sensor histidine kinase PilS (NtrC family)
MPPPADGALARARVGMRNRAGEPLHLGLSRSPLRGARGDEDGTILIFQDLTRLVEIEDELSRSRRLAAVGQLATGLAHEIRNPLGAMSGAIELLAAELPELGANGRRLARIVQRETERLNRLVVDFLAYARPGPLRRERCPLREIASELAELYARSEHHPVRLELEVPGDLYASGDPDALRQVLWNLLRNAAEAKPQDGVVRLRARRERDGLVRLEVCDRGEGMSRDVLDRLFEPFFSTRPKGTGLGLATVHRLMERQGGSLQVHSAPGQGTTFAVLLPEAS